MAKFEVIVFIVSILLCPSMSSPAAAWSDGSIHDQVVGFRLALPDLHKATDTVECRGIRYSDSFLIKRLLSRLNVFWQ